MIADSIRTKYDRATNNDDDEVMDLNNPEVVAKLRRMADAQYK